MSSPFYAVWQMKSQICKIPSFSVLEKGAGLLYRKRRIERGNGLDNFFIQKNMTAREAGMTVKEYTALLGISKRLLADIKFGGETCL